MAISLSGSLSKIRVETSMAQHLNVDTKIRLAHWECGRCSKSPWVASRWRFHGPNGAGPTDALANRPLNWQR